MPVFKFIDFNDPAIFIMNYDMYESVTTQDFTDDRVESYHQSTRFCSHLQFFENAFLTPKDDK